MARPPAKARKIWTGTSLARSQAAFLHPPFRLLAVAPYGPRRFDLPVSVLIVCPDSMELSFLTGALSGHFSVLAARDADEASRLVERFGPCRLAYLALADDCESAIQLTRDLNGSKAPIYALVHAPCPDVVDRAADCGRLDGVCLLPMAPAELRAKTREVLGLRRPGHSGRAGRNRGGARSAVLTREEVDFLIGRPLADAPVVCRPPDAGDGATRTSQASAPVHST